MSEQTPRTDAFVNQHESKRHCSYLEPKLILFARQLECKLDAAQAQITTLQNASITREVQRDREVAALEARIDALMLEYCPDDMAPEQLENWAKHQQPVKEKSDE